MNARSYKAECLVVPTAIPYACTFSLCERMLTCSSSSSSSSRSVSQMHHIAPTVFLRREELPQWLFSRTTFYHLLSPSTSVASFAAMHGVASYFFLYFSACLFAFSIVSRVPRLFEWTTALPRNLDQKNRCLTLTRENRAVLLLLVWWKMFELYTRFRYSLNTFIYTHLSFAFFSW